jgi:hypothetical protein
VINNRVFIRVLFKLSLNLLYEEKIMANKIKEKTDVQVVLLRQLNELREKQLKLPVRDVKRYTKLSNAICDTAKTLLTYF